MRSLAHYSGLRTVSSQDDGTDVPGSYNEPEDLIEFEVDDDGQSSDGE